MCIHRVKKKFKFECHPRVEKTNYTVNTSQKHGAPVLFLLFIFYVDQIHDRCVLC